MWDFSLQLEEDVADYAGDFSDIVWEAPAIYRLLTSLLDDPDTPQDTRTGLLAAVAYFILPYDAIPEEIHGPRGYLDDVYVAAVMVEEVRKAGGQELVERNWDSDRDVIPLIEQIIADAEEYFEDPQTREAIFEYLGHEGLKERLAYHM